MHLDVKPDNFLIRSQPTRDDAPDLLLTDFGLARADQRDLTPEPAGARYASLHGPEQCVGQPVFASDQYSLAIMAYELLTGSPPFQGTPMQVMFAHMQAAPDPSARAQSAGAARREAVMQKDWRRGRQERFSSVATFAGAFRRLFRASSRP